ncbi:MAG: type IV pilus biogenesis/stability protein PilW [Pseudomonadales bacterium]|nr:type IV pilus biogenesis/stability protein PilW [Pseudomonadales bacterium]
MQAFKHLIGLVLALVCLMVAGCVTERTDEAGKPVATTDKKVDERSALNDYVTLANGYLREGKREQALRAINRGLAIDDDSPELLNVLAEYYQTDDEDALAEKQYKKAISADSSYTGTYLNYGVFLYRQNRIDEACEKFARATQDVMYPRRDGAFLNYGICLRKQGKLKEAEEALRRSYVNNARNPTVILELAELKFDAGEFEQCAQLYEKYTSMTPQNARSLWLGIRLASAQRQDDKVASYALLLKNQFPASQQYNEYKAWSKTK